MSQDYSSREWRVFVNLFQKLTIRKTKSFEPEGDRGLALAYNRAVHRRAYPFILFYE